MHCIDFGAAHDPALNLAREEHLFNRLADGEDLLLFYINTHAVVIGRNQLPWAEVSPARLTRARLPLMRRVSGGGAVYHDPGNLNFSILLQADAPGRPNAATILQPVVRALQSLGLPARLSDRNAVFVDGRKVSGTAQYMTAGKVLTHGTLLVDADLRQLAHCLVPDPVYRITSRGRPSVRSPVVNLETLLPGLSMNVLVGALRQAFAAVHGPIGRGTLPPADEQAARNLAAKYRSWSWNIGRSPRCTLEWEDAFEGDVCRCRLQAARGVISAVEVAGPPDRQEWLQRRAEEWLLGRRLGAEANRRRTPKMVGTPDKPRTADFHDWLENRLPATLPMP